MAALHPETVRLLRKALDDTNAQHKTDLARLAKMHIESKSLMAERLRNRIAASIPVMRDLERILPPMHDAGTPPIAEPDAHAQWIANGRALLDLLETNPDLPLGNLRVAVHSGAGGDDNAGREFVDAAAKALGKKPSTTSCGDHYSVGVTLGNAEYEVVHVPSAAMWRHHEINRLGKAAFAEQEASA